ncbi:MAG TPA: TetR/AcrR family transcriptional regulator [Solirubrobacterales bacterium]|nr:TetR/AcrR family transcriptional regulator [Solirubrobacterales bacterium]
MADRQVTADRRARTPKGEATRQRIIDAAADLMRLKGVGNTTLDDVVVASQTSKSQLYNHFSDKADLTRAVVQRWGERRLEQQEDDLSRLDSIRGLERWRDAIVQRNTIVGGAHGCILGSLAIEVADRDDEARRTLRADFQTWERLLAEGLERMRIKGILRADADPRDLATGIMAALQGGYLLAQTAHDSAPMAVALDMAIEHVKTFATGS